MKSKTFLRPLSGTILLALLILPLTLFSAAEPGGVEDSYHGQMGRGTGHGMLEKWCALPNFSYLQQGGAAGWAQQPCNACHIGAAWNPEKSEVKCEQCHTRLLTEDVNVIDTIDGCMACHIKDTAKRGDVFSPQYDVHIAQGFLCQDCHIRETDETSDHQFLKGTAIDTSEKTMKGTLSCTSMCHEETPHDIKREKGMALNKHLAKIACETCHTGLRPGKALKSRQWNVFKVEGETLTAPITTKREPGWLPEHKWYDNKGVGAAGDYKLPILGYTERRNNPGAKIYPFNAVTVDWFVKKKNSDFDEVIIVPEVKAADDNLDGTVTVDEMREVYRKATLKTADMNFSINHSVVPAGAAFSCNDCHGNRGWVLDWKQLGYGSDPYFKSKGRGKKN